ncbi:alpha/beta hydrolase [Weissella uvarum]|nr:alpha/beta hydrolase [Weissella uvarum]
MMKIVISVVIAIAVAMLIAAGVFFYIVEVRADKSFVTGGSQTQKADPLDKQKKAWSAVPNKQAVNLTAKDGVKLKGQYVPAAQPSNKTAIVIHGFAVDHREVIPYANMMHQQGYNVLLADNRAAGKSGGKFIGYGYLEAKDYLEWIQRLIKQNPKSEIVVYGTSLGGATTMDLAGMNPPKQVKAYIEDCGYNSMREELLYEANQLYHIPRWLANPLISIMSVYSKVLAGYSYDQADSVAALKRNTRPMLFIHGKQDGFVPSYMLNDVYEATRGPKAKFEVDNADHMEAYEKDQTAYEKQVKSFLNQYVH